MKKSEVITELAAALSRFQSQVDGAKKSAENPFYKSRYADLSEIWNTIRVPLTSNGLSVVQGGGEDPGDGETVHLETVLMHESGQWISETMSAKVVQKLDKQTGVIYVDPQGAGSAITYLRRYGLSSILGIHQEDDDGSAASGGGAINTKKAITDILLELRESKINDWDNDEIMKARFLEHLDIDSVKMCQDTKKLAKFHQFLIKEKTATGDKSTADKAAILKAAKRCGDLMSSFPMMGNKSIEYRQAIKDAGANNNLTKLNEIEAELEAMKQKAEAAAAKDKQPKPEIVVEPEPEERQDTPEEAKKKEIIAMFEKMSKAGNFNTVHFSNSMKKRLGVTYEGDDWKAALLSMDIPIATMDKGLEYWEESYKTILANNKKAKPASKWNKETIAEIEAKVNALPDSIDKEQLMAGLSAASVDSDLDFLQEAYDALLLQ